MIYIDYVVKELLPCIVHASHWKVQSQLNQYQGVQPDSVCLREPQGKSQLRFTHVSFIHAQKRRRS